MPYFGCREFPANFELLEEDSTEKTAANAYAGEDKDLGYMLFDFDYSNPEEIQPMFFRAVLKNGIMDLRDCEVIR